jgi:phage tail tape-measure protein
MGKIVGSNYINPDEKFETVFKTVTKVTATIGTAVGGGVIGQILIPIPVFGAMIGGIVGGAVGTVFGKAIQNIKTHVPIKFTVLVDRLRESRADEGFWSFGGLGG